MYVAAFSLNPKGLTHVIAQNLVCLQHSKTNKPSSTDSLVNCPSDKLSLLKAAHSSTIIPLFPYNNCLTFLDTNSNTFSQKVLVSFNCFVPSQSVSNTLVSLSSFPLKSLPN